jgi:hypothetical protein
MPARTMASAIWMRRVWEMQLNGCRSQSTEHPKWFHEFQPMGGVRAKPFSHPTTCNKLRNVAKN